MAPDFFEENFAIRRAFGTSPELFRSTSVPSLEVLATNRVNSCYKIGPGVLPLAYFAVNLSDTRRLVSRHPVTILIFSRFTPEVKLKFMKPIVGIIDYQMGNLRSVEKAIERVGGEPVVSGDPESFSRASHLILPGVGAFRDAIAELERRHLVPLVRDWTESGKPFLGICLGLQMLFDISYEGGEHRGLGIIPGEVVRFPSSSADSQNHLKVPHMGWNRVRSTYSDDPLLSGIPADPYFYFVHSYYAAPKNAGDVWLESDYGYPFCAAIRRNNIYATQFHPEKSQSNGLKLLQNFLELS